MKIFRKGALVIALAIFAVSVNYALAHPGRTDANGGHTCRTNCTENWGLQYGEYHYHGFKAKAGKAVTKTIGKQGAKGRGK